MWSEIQSQVITWEISDAFWCHVWTAVRVIWISTKSGYTWTQDIRSEQGLKGSRGWPSRDGSRGSVKTASPSPPFSSLTPPLNTSTRLCLRWRCPIRHWPLFLYHLLAFSPPPPVSSALFQDRKGGRLRTRRPDPAESLLMRSLFSAKSPFFLVNLLLVLSVN